MKVERAVRLTYTGGYPVYPVRYVIFGEAPRRAALHFFNSSEVVITGLKYRVTEKDENGTVLHVDTYEQRGLFAERGSEFAVADLNLAKACASIEASVEAVLSDDYEYVVGGDGVTLRYGASEQKQEEPIFLYSPKYRASRKRKRYIWLAALIVLGCAAVAAATAWRLGILGKIERTDKAALAAEMGTVAEYVEA